MSGATPLVDFFVAGGTLRADVPSYVQRPTDDELYDLALAGEFCYVLTPRQMGKSSLMVRTARRLQARGVQAAIIDLTAIGTDLSVERWYLALLSGIGRRLRLSVSPEAWWQARSTRGHVQRFIDFMRDVVLVEVPGQVVIFVDEIDTTLRLDFRDDFFAAIRAIYNERAADPEFERLTFVLLGVASPTELIRDPARTPFNIGHPITLEEFSRDDAVVLRDGLEEIHPGQGKEAFDRIYYWTNGHPYLTQKLCLAVAEPEDELGPDVDGLVETLFLSEEARRETNLQFVQDKILTHPQCGKMLGLYKDVVRGKRVRDDGQSPVQIQLKLSGLVKVKNGTLRVRNRIYRRAFDRAWVRRHTAINPYPIIIGVLAAILLMVVGLLAYDVWAGIRFNDCATRFYQTDDPNRRLEDLACAFKLRTLLLPANYSYQAQDMFSGLSAQEQLDLIRARGGKDSDRVVVVRSLYVTLADVGGTDGTGPLLDEMAGALRFVDGEEPASLLREIEAWQRGRAIVTEAREKASFGAEMEQVADGYNTTLSFYSQAIDEAQRYDRENAAILYERARVLTALGRYADALDDLEQVASIASRGPQATPTPRPTLPITPTRRRTATPTRELTRTVVPTKGPTLTKIPSTLLPAMTPTVTRTPTATATRTPSPTPTPTQTPAPEPTPTPGPPAIEDRFVTPSDIVNAVRALINASPGLVETLARASADTYPNLQAAGLAPTPTPTPTSPPPTVTPGADQTATAAATPIVLVPEVTELPVRSARVGLHGRNDQLFEEADYALLREAKIESAVLMSYTDPEVFDRIKGENPDIEIIVRLFDDRMMTGGHPSPQEFAERMSPIMENLRPYAVKFQVHNEPNHDARIEGWGSTDEDARDFNEWYLQTYDLLKSAHPWASLGFPALAIPDLIHRDRAWLEICRPAIEQADWLGVHAYWQTPQPGQNEQMRDDRLGATYQYYHSQFPNKTLEITEFANSNISAEGYHTSEEVIAQEYVEWLQELFKHDYVGSANAFILSSQDPQWEIFGWRTEEGVKKPVVNWVAQMYRPPLEPIPALTPRPTEIVVPDTEPAPTPPLSAAGSAFEELVGHSAQVNSVAWSADGRLASGSEDDTVILWDVERGLPAQTLEGHVDAVMGVAWSSDGRLASGSRDGTIIVWDPTQASLGRGLPAQTLEGHSGMVSSVAWSADGRLASGSWDGTVIVWDLERGLPAQTLEGHTFSVLGVAWSADGRLASGSDDGTVIIWNLERGLPTRRLKEGHNDAVNSVAWSADGRLASGSDDGTVIIWDLEHRLPAQILEDPFGAFFSVAWSADGRLASGSVDGTVIIWDLEHGLPEQTLEGHTYSVQGVAWSADGRLASGSRDETVIVWDPTQASLGRGLPSSLFVVHGEGGPMDDPRVQEAVARAVDWTAIFERFPSAGPAATLEFPDLQTLTSQVPFEPEQARALLAEAGYPDGFLITEVVSEQDGDLVDVGEAMIEYLSAAGLEVEFRVQPPEEVTATVFDILEVQRAVLWLVWE